MEKLIHHISDLNNSSKSMTKTNERKALALETTAKAIEEANILELFTANFDNSDAQIAEFVRLRRGEVLAKMKKPAEPVIETSMLQQAALQLLKINSDDSELPG